MNELCFTPARKLAQLVRARKLSATEVMQDFIAQIERAPAREAANAISRAIFSFTEYSNTTPWRPEMRANESVTSDEGVPG